MALFEPMRAAAYPATPYPKYIAHPQYVLNLYCKTILIDYWIHGMKHKLIRIGCTTGKWPLFWSSLAIFSLRVKVLVIFEFSGDDVR
jgi:hypothetical protein